MAHQELEIRVPRHQDYRYPAVTANRFRGCQTIEHWHYVRSSELRNIIPQIQQVDFIINSAMPYELPLYRYKMLDQFTHWAEQYQNDPLRLDAYERAVRVRDLLSEVLPYPDDSIVPPDSVIREFIGGSIYSY